MTRPATWPVERPNTSHQTHHVSASISTTVHSEKLSLGALAWAAAGIDPGYTPLGLVELLRRKRTPQPEELDRLLLVEPIDPLELKRQWLLELDDAEAFVKQRPVEEVGCLYWNTVDQQVVDDQLDSPDVVPHFGRLFGVRPTVRSEP